MRFPAKIKPGPNGRWLEWQEKPSQLLTIGSLFGIFAGGAYFKTKSGKNFKGGLFRTSPGSKEWETLARGLPEMPEARIVRFHPTEPDVVCAVIGSLVERIRASGNELAAPGLTIKLAKEFGFCYGVERAIDLAYAARRSFPARLPWRARRCSSSTCRPTTSGGASARSRSPSRTAPSTRTAPCSTRPTGTSSTASTDRSSPPATSPASGTPSSSATPWS